MMPICKCNANPGGEWSRTIQIANRIVRRIRDSQNWHRARLRLDGSGGTARGAYSGGGQFSVQEVFAAKSRRAGKIRIALASHGGFTLLEMVVSFGIFAVVIVIAIGAMLAVNNAQIKASNIQNIQDNLRFAVESITKEMRTGKTFLPFGGSPPAYAGLTFTRSDGSQVGYCLDGTALKKISGSGQNCSLGSAVSGTNVIVEQLVFYVLGQSPGPLDGQPRITVSLRARSADPKLATSFRLQTTVTQRERDF